MRPQRPPSRLLSRMLAGHSAPEARAAIATDAAEVRRYVEQNLLLGTMCLECYPSERAFSSVVSALRVAKLAAEATKKADLVRVIDGCEGPLRAILRRFEGGDIRATVFDLATLSAACQRVMDALGGFADTDLVLAYELDRVYRDRQRAAA